MGNIELIGFVAGSLVAISMFPQVIKSRKTRSTKDVAISRSIINLTGQILWIIYGFYINSYALIVMSGISLIMNAGMIMLKLRFG